MHPPCSGLVGKTTRYWQDPGRVFCRLWRDDAEGDKHAFIPLVGPEHPTLESINRLTHENELKDYLDGAWALRPVELVRERGRTMLVVEYTGGEPLDRLIGAARARAAAVISESIGIPPHLSLPSFRNPPLQSVS